MPRIPEISKMDELECCIKDINNRINVINHYLQEWEALMLFSQKDSGRKFMEYSLFFKYVRKAYLDMVFINLNVIFDRSSKPNIYRVNDYIAKLNPYVKNLNLEDEFDDVAFNIKNIRNKVVAHIDILQIEKVYRKFQISKKNLDDIIFYIDKRLECLILHSGIEYTKNEIIYLENEGINAVLNSLPAENIYKKTAKGIKLQKGFDNICEIFN